MPRPSQLPDSLSYLNPLRKQLAALPEEEVNEEIDPSRFQSVFLRRIQGLPPEEAKVTLRADLLELQQWLNQPEQQAERLHFVLGFLLTAAKFPEKLSAVSVEPRRLQVEMQFPPEAKARRLDGGWKVRWRGFTVFVLPCEKAGFEGKIDLFREPVQHYAKLLSSSVLPVQFGRLADLRRCR